MDHIYKLKMYLRVLIWLLPIIISCSSTRPYYSNDSNWKCVLKLDSGINSIVLDVSKIKDVQLELGPGRLVKYKVPRATEFNFLPHHGFKLYYDSLGLEFMTSSYLIPKKRISYLNISPECQCRTIDGIGIGSSADELGNHLNQPVLNGKDKSVDQIWIQTSNNDEYHLSGLTAYFRQDSGRMKIDSLKISGENGKIKAQ